MMMGWTLEEKKTGCSSVVNKKALLVSVS